MAGFKRHRGLTAPLPLANVDTDQLIPARFMSAPRKAGYGRFLLHDLRHDADGHPQPGLTLDEPAARGASVLIARRNFGCGSSREAAVYALVDAGFKAVLAPSFGDIFAGNAVNNGLLPARLAEGDVEALLAAGPQVVEIDLEASWVLSEGRTIRFELDPVHRLKLLNGWDDIDLTRAHADEIAAFASARRKAQPWLWPRPRV